MDPFIGGVEILTSSGESLGVAGQRWTPDVVPAVVDALHGVRGLVAGTPEPQQTGRMPQAQWTGVDASNQPVTVLLWKEDPYEETAIAQAIAAAIAEGQGA